MTFKSEKAEVAKKDAYHSGYQSHSMMRIARRQSPIALLQLYTSVNACLRVYLSGFSIRQTDHY